MDLSIQRFYKRRPRSELRSMALVVGRRTDELRSIQKTIQQTILINRCYKSWVYLKSFWVLYTSSGHEIDRPDPFCYCHILLYGPVSNFWLITALLWRLFFLIVSTYHVWCWTVVVTQKYMSSALYLSFKCLLANRRPKIQGALLTFASRILQITGPTYSHFETVKLW